MPAAQRFASYEAQRAAPPRIEWLDVVD